MAWLTRIAAAALVVCGVLAVVIFQEERFFSAALLVGEPVIAAVAAGCVYVSLTLRRRGWAFAVLVAWVGAAVAVRIPRSLNPVVMVEPSFARVIGGCAPALRLPSGGFNLLQWTVDRGNTEAVANAILAEGADVNVIFGDDLRGVAMAVVDGLGGEVHVHDDEGTRFFVHTRGVFNLCGADSEWAQGMDESTGAAVSFVGVREGLIFPLLVTRFPHLGDPGDYLAARGRSWQRVAGILDAMESSLAVVVADAQAPWTFTGLDNGMRGMAMRPVRVPPTWPARIWGIPTPPLHPFDRAWVGPGWRVERSERVRMTTATRDAVRTRFVPAVVTSDP